MGFARAPLQTNWPQGNWSFVYSRLNWLHQSFVRSVGSARMWAKLTPRPLCDTHGLHWFGNTLWHANQTARCSDHLLSVRPIRPLTSKANMDIFIAKIFTKIISTFGATSGCKNLGFIEKASGRKILRWKIRVLFNFIFGIDAKITFKNRSMPSRLR